MLLMSVTLAVAAVRLAKLDTLVQQMAATESLAAVDTICVDKTGTLTSGELELVGVDVADPAERRGRPPGAGAVRRQLGRAQPHPRGDRRALSRRRAEKVSGEVPFSSEWKWSAVTLNGRGAGDTYVLGAPDVLAAQGALELPPRCRVARSSTPARGSASSPSARAQGALPADPAAEAPPKIAPLALVVLDETLRPDAAETIAFMREQNMDLKLISGDARETVTAVAAVDRRPGRRRA